jgi:hypothetical protein
MRNTISKLALTATLAVAFTFHTSFAQCTASLFAGGAGTAANPYQISTAEQLQNLNQCLGETNQGNHYALNNDIDLTAYLQGEGNNGGAGWAPIGNLVENSDDISTFFSGKLDGKGHKVSGLWINRPETNNAGLFGFIIKAEIKDIGVEIDNAKGGIKGNRSVGGLAGIITMTNPADPAISTISGSYTTGNVTGKEGVGGLAGLNKAAAITNSYATGNISGEEYVAGLVGAMENNGTIINSYATGSVMGNRDVGGLVASNNRGTISNSYATGSVTGSGCRVGGLVGNNNRGTITNSYATGSVTAGCDSDVGGLVGNNGSYGTVTNSYYDTQTTGQTDTDKGTGKTTAEMKTQSTYAGWDFETIWEINAAKNSGYPALRWQTNTTPIRLPQIATGSIRVQSTANAIVLENLPKNAKIELYNLQGKQIYSTHSVNSQILKIQVQTKGIYIVKVSNQTIRTIVR